MAVSVQTNKPALIALQTLNKTNDDLASVQNRVSTGLRVATAKDNAAVYAIAQGQRADVAALSAVKFSLDRATSITDVALAAGEGISDLLNKIKEKVTAAIDPSIDATSRSLLNNDFKALVHQVAQITKNAVFDGANILDGSIGDIRFLSNADANSYMTLSVKNMSLGGGIVTVSSTATISTVTVATAVLAQINSSITNVNSALGDIGAQARMIESHNKFIAKLSDTLTAGIGDLVDADLAKESARLQALQVAQQLGVQSLSIANSSPQTILSLFQQ